MWRRECILAMVDQHLPQIQMFQTTGSYILDMARERGEERSFSFVTTCIMYTYSVSVEIQNSHSLHKLWQWGSATDGVVLKAIAFCYCTTSTASCSTIVFYITG